MPPACPVFTLNQHHYQHTLFPNLHRPGAGEANCLQTGLNLPHSPFLSQTGEGEAWECCEFPNVYLAQRVLFNRIIRSPSNSPEQWGEKPAEKGVASGAQRRGFVSLTHNSKNAHIYQSQWIPIKAEPRCRKTGDCKDAPGERQKLSPELFAFKIPTHHHPAAPLATQKVSCLNDSFSYSMWEREGNRGLAAFLCYAAL